MGDDLGPKSRIACVQLSALPLESAFATQAALQKIPCAVRSEVRSRRLLADVSDAALAKRIARGMSETEAHARFPKLEIRARDPAKELQALGAVAEMLLAFGPVVEMTPPSFVFVEIGKSKSVLSKKLERADDRGIAEAILHMIGKAGHRCRVVIASSLDVGRSVLQLSDRDRGRAIVVVDPGREREMLAALPIDAILWTDLRSDLEGKKREELVSVRASLSILGVDDIGRLQKLPAAQVTSRFGDAGALLMKRALAEGRRPLIPFVPPDRLIEEIELDQPTDDLEPILFLLKRLFDRMEARLDARALSARALDLTFTLEPSLENEIDHHTLRPRSSKRNELIRAHFARATRKAKTMMAVVREKLASGPLSGAVVALSVEAISKEIDRGSQLDLFTAHPRRVEEVSELVSRLAAALGEEAVFSPELSDSHRPETGWSKKPFDADRALEEPRWVRPTHSDRGALRVVAPEGAIDAPLPAVTSDLRVTGAVGETAKISKDAKWPKPVPRKAEDEPVPDLPPRPLEVLSTPEPASFGEGVLRWRGQRLPVSQIGGAERLECEWWTSSPLARDYWVAETTDGRRFWLFYEPGGQLYVHGIFD